MADFAPNFTARYRVRYSALGKSHSVTWRVASTVTDPAPVAAKFGLFLADLVALLYTDWTVVGADFAPADSDVFLPAPAPDSPSGTFVISAPKAAAAAIPISYVARSSAGGKGRFFLYGTGYAQTLFDGTEADYRILSTEDATIAATVTRLNETSPVLVCNDDHAAVWYDYVNIKPNDKWVRKLRRG